MTQLEEAVLTDPVTRINFFNGRLLTAEDLRVERAANRRKDTQLARGVGSGVVEGLWIDPLARDPSVLSVAPGLAISPHGDVIELTQRLNVSLGTRRPPSASPDSDFATCARISDGVVLEARGIYLLVLAPVEQLSAERAPRAGLGNDGRAFGCEARFVYETAAFRLLPIAFDDQTFDVLDAEILTAIDAGEADDPILRSMRRNLVAHLFLGTIDRRNAHGRLFARNGTEPLVSYGPLERLRERGLLGPREVPLALVSWLGATLDYVDVWPVRRPPLRPARSETWPIPGDLRATIEREAAFLQFQAHVDALSTAGLDPRTLRARDCFRYLPAAGFLPFEVSAEGPTINTNPIDAPSRLRGAGMTVPPPPRFFEGVVFRPPTFADAATLDQLLRLSFCHEPVDLQDDSFLWLYVPWQVERARASGASASATLVFASPHVSEAGVARFDVSRYDYANFAGGSV